MSKERLFTGGLALCLLLLTAVVAAYALEPGTQEGEMIRAALGTSFTFQGRLTDGGSPAAGEYDLRFILYDADIGGSQVGAILTTDNAPVEDGLFTVMLDFGAVFTGEALWLEMAVRPGGDTGMYTTLSPRQELAATPYAIYSTAAPWSGLVGVPAGFADGVDDNTIFSAGNQLDLDGDTLNVLEGSGSDLDADLLDGQEGSHYLAWGHLEGVPAGFADDVDDDTLFGAGFGLDLDNSTFNVVTSTVQQRVMGSCGAGSAVRMVNADGTVDCEPISGAADITAVYAGEGLGGGGESGDVSLHVISSTVQSRVEGACGAGSSIREVNQDGTVVCETDDDTAYSAGIGLELTEAEFAITPDYQLPQKCDDGEIPQWSDREGWECGDGRGDQVKQLVQDFVVSSKGSVQAGDVVGFLDGYVQKGFRLGGEISTGPEYVFNPANSFQISAAALSSIRFVVTYGDSDNSNFGMAVVGEISGDTITYGPETMFNAASTSYISVAALSSTRFVVAYHDFGNSSFGMAVVGQISGTTIAFGPEYVFNSVDTMMISVAALSASQFVVAYRDFGSFDDGYGTAIIGNVSGTVITYGTPTVFNSADTGFVSVAALSSSKFVTAYQDCDNFYHGTAVICDVSGTTITCGSEHVFNATYTSHIVAAALSSSQFVVAYSDSGNSDFGTASIGDVSGTAIAYGPEYVFNSAATAYHSAATLSSTQFVLVFYDADNSSYGTAVIGEVLSTTIAYDPEIVFNPASTGYVSAATLSPSRFAVAYADMGSLGYGSATILDKISGDLVGIAADSGGAGQSVPVIVSGISDIHKSLVPGLTYYSTAHGDLITDVTDCRVGIAISSTALLLSGDRDNGDQFFGDMVFANEFRITEAGSYEGLILKNQLGREVLTISDEGALTTYELDLSGLIRLTPSTTPAVCTLDSWGAVYYDGQLNEPCFCDGVSWQRFGGAGVCEPVEGRDLRSER